MLDSALTTLADFRAGDTFVLQEGGQLFTIIEHVPGLYPLTRCTTPNVKLGTTEEHFFASHFHGLPVSFAVPSPPKEKPPAGNPD